MFVLVGSCEPITGRLQQCCYHTLEAHSSLQTRGWSSKTCGCHICLAPNISNFSSTTEGRILSGERQRLPHPVAPRRRAHRILSLRDTIRWKTTWLIFGHQRFPLWFRCLIRESTVAQSEITGLTYSG